MPSDNFGNVTHATMQIRRSATVAPSDANSINTIVGQKLGPTRGLLVDASGTVKVLYADGTSSDTLTLASGIWHPMNILQVFATGTSATGIHVGW